ncbi:iron chelate uptake ABC transporter family permease subunit [Fulvimarina sp. 2208YS6-2-32]|uniref:Iron chelate uptake ABC transporter family permease subunit n=1 Tax=Fulvimarina uroteuthidis TaxID=3098149 RepID=A0ABU5I616_9HYPH|nr:iron chelate uptake ABC transporter family permease subunit [Fulvimarina sp. 2208YS6-2-32]MDY8110835.1 iron chelate uptake ABC transporter family permease subunit [Fulvimarina sp. 2208YS6-2-32]
MTHRSALLASGFGLGCLVLISLLVGAGDLSAATIVSGRLSADDLKLLFVSRLPRTLATLLSGAGLAVSGLIMQMLSSNRFVEPSTVGVTESAAFGMLTVTLLAPAMPVFAKMLVAAGFGLAGGVLFMAILARLRLRTGLIVPLVGLILSGIIGAGTSFLAYRYDLMQSLGAWMTGDFSMVLAGRYELLWIAFALTGFAVLAADRFTIAGMGRDVAIGLGLSYGQTVFLGLVLVSLVSAVTIVSVGAIPFVGLVVPNLVSILAGDNGRRTVPYVALSGAALVLACDIVGRIVRAPYEIPVGTTMGLIGSLVFLSLLFSGRTARG